MVLIKNLNLKSFESYPVFHPSFVNLGKKYYDNGQVINLTQSSTNEWQTIIKGIEDYSVTVEFKDFEIIKSICNCSFNGPHCIHKVAAYYAIYNYIFPNEVSERPFSEITLSEMKDDIIVQDAYWKLREAYLELNDSCSNEDITKTFRSIRNSLTNVKKIAKNNPVLVVRLLIVFYYELTEIKGFIMDWRDWNKFEARWYKLYDKAQEKTLVIISEIQDEKIARCVTDLVLNETLELQCSPENFSEDHSGIYLEFLSHQRELHFKILIELSPLAQSYEQIKQLLNAPRLLMPREKELFMNDLLLKQRNDEISPQLNNVYK